jgi:hypothetical protein
VWLDTELWGTIASDHQHQQQHHQPTERLVIAPLQDQQFFEPILKWTLCFGGPTGAQGNGNEVLTDRPQREISIGRNQVSALPLLLICMLSNHNSCTTDGRGSTPGQEAQRCAMRWLITCRHGRCFTATHHHDNILVYISFKHVGVTGTAWVGPP